METPVYDFVEAYVKKNMVRAHMPGHKGKIFSNNISQLYPYDITEIKGADSLFEADGIIAQSEKNASKLFGTDGTFYSVGGSTLCIQAMLAMVCKSGDTVAAARNSHKAFINSCILLGLDVEWIYPVFENNSIISGEITAVNVEKALMAEKKPICVYITSPDYLGKIADVKAIAQVCRRFNVTLLVDNAHGAHLAFLENPCHPIMLGADICCDSAHKTLPVLTGGAYLHTASNMYSLKAKEAMSLFASSSPSYLTIQSLDLCNRYLSDNFRQDLRIITEEIQILKDKLSQGIKICQSEPLKLTVYTLPMGRTGFNTAEYLRYKNIEVEYADQTHVMLMFSTANDKKDLDAVYDAFRTMPCPRIWLAPPDFQIPMPVKAMTPREAYFMPSETVSVDDCCGRICGKAKTVCPPCVPVAVGGEVLDDNCMKILKMYSIFNVDVLK